MTELLLIHGSCFGAWAWEALIPALARHGHHARAIDLPGRGGGATTLAAQARAIDDALTAHTILVGHSAGGFPITAATSPQIAGRIYLAAYIPAPGQSVASLRRAGPSQPMKGAFQITPDRSAYTFAPERCRDLFFHDCPDPAQATARLCAEPIAPQETPLSHGPTQPAAAIICTEDRAIPPDWQRAMAKGLPQRDLASGHCPFLSMPEALAATLSLLIQQIENPTQSVAP
jgi:pimeloyl-ACP methyl ester carboxylesterase